MIDKIILEAYQTAVALNQRVPAELKRSLKTSERVPRFLAQLKKEVAALPPNLVSREVISMLTTDLTNMFLYQVERAAQQKQMSEVERHRIQISQEKSRIINNAVDTGIINDEVFDVLKED
jgi:hypothetical protein